MPKITFYKPNTKGTGSAINFYVGERDNALWLNLLKQSGPMDNKPFMASKDDPTKKISVKFSQVETGALIKTLQRGIPAGGEKGLYHSSPKGVSRISFKPYLDKVSGEDKGFSLAVSKEPVGDSVNKISVLIGLTHAEAAVLEEFLRMALRISFESKPESQEAEPAAEAPLQAPAPVEKKPLGEDIDF